MIIQTSRDDLSKAPYQNILYPDQFVSEKDKQEETWIKRTMDYFSNVAYAQYIRNNETFAKNYDLVNGILTTEDFYEEPAIKSFTEMLLKDLELPKYVQHYSIFNGPLSSAVGELTKRPDTHRVKAFDDDSRSEEMQFRSELLRRYLTGIIQQTIQAKLAAQGIKPDSQQVEQMTMQELQDEIMDYTSEVESWSNHVLEACKVAFNMKEQSEEGFKDMFTCGREYFLPIEDNSKIGFNVKGVNPKNAWYSTTPDKKWTSAAYFGGTIEVMEISQIIEEVPDLTKDEIDHLREPNNSFGVLNVGQSNYGNNSISGIDSIHYNTYSPAMVEMRLQAESDLMHNNVNTLGNIFGLASNIGAYGLKFIVVRAYWLSKKLIKKVTFVNEQNQEETVLVDENYKSGDIPTELEVEEGWINQWYEGIKIGPDIYHVKPYKLLSRFPLIGVNLNIKNSEVRAPIDFLKPFQAIYNLCMNQLWELLNKEKGPVIKVQLRRIPTPKDGSGEDAIEQWEQDARERGIIFEDDSPENMKVPMSNTQQTQMIDLSLTNLIKSRYELATMIKNEAYELIGFSRQRLASVQATETATATNTAIAQSYAQTEPLFATHDYLLNQVYQAIVDCAQYTQSKKPTSTISYITSLGEAASIQIKGTDLENRDLWVFDTSRPQDQEVFNKVQELAQPYIQNGGDLYDVFELFSNNSMRSIKKIFKQFKDERDAMKQQEMQQQQAELQQKQQQFELEKQIEIKQHQADQINDNMNKEKDRQTKIETAIITSLGMNKETDADVNGDNIPDIYETQTLLQKATEISKKHDIEMQKLQLQKQQLDTENQNKEKDRQVEREKMKNDLKIASKRKASTPKKK